MNRWRCALAAVATAAFASASHSHAASVYADYYAGTGSQVWAPIQWADYSPYAPGGSSGGVSRHLGLNAWEVRDASASPSNPVLFTELYPQYAAQASAQGWRFQAKASLVDTYRDGPAMGLLAFFGNRGYGAAVGLNTSGQLIGQLFGQTQTFLLAPAGGVATAYHDLELKYSPQTGRVSFLFDGGEVANWAGVQFVDPHPNSFRWGSVNAGQRGVMRFHSVKTELGPFPVGIPGDFNGDGGVDAADYTLWRDSMGKTGPNLAADANGDQRIDNADLAVWRQTFFAGASAPTFSQVPEPASASLVLASAIVVIATTRRQWATVATHPPQSS